MDLVEAYFDESYGDGSPFLCLGGYIFSKESAIAADAEWQRMLTDYGLPYFRMSQCAHGNGPFKKLLQKQRLSVEKEAIHLTKAYSTHGIALALDTNYFSLIPKHGLIQTPYSFLCVQALNAVQMWADQERFTGEIAYFFESGHANAGEACAVMNRVFSDNALKSAYRCRSHTFTGKTDRSLLQAADMLAWHWFTRLKHHSQGKAVRRKDFAALVGMKNVRGDLFDKEAIENWLSETKASRGVVAP